MPVAIHQQIIVVIAFACELVKMQDFRHRGIDNRLPPGGPALHR